MTISGILPAASENISAALRQIIRKEEQTGRIRTAEKRYSYDSIHADRARDNSDTKQAVSRYAPELEGECPESPIGRIISTAQTVRFG